MRTKPAVGTELRYTSIRTERELLHKARYYLNQEGRSIAEFFTASLRTYVTMQEKLLLGQNKSLPVGSSQAVPEESELYAG